MYRFKENNPNYELVENNIFWERYPNRTGDWALLKATQELGKRRFSDKMTFNQCGWVERVLFGKNKGKYQALIPFLCEVESSHKDYKDYKIIGVFDSVSEAKKAVLKVF